MSGVFGIFSKDGTPVAPTDLRAMRDAMAFWGPDSDNLVAAGPVGLGHVLLASETGPPPESQTLAGPEAPHLKIAADASLDNRDELCAALLIGREEQRRLADSALILRAVQKWGRDCVERLSGEFAFTIWDASRQELFCARDHMGFRPFYYFDSGRHFVFATDVKALLAVPFMPRRLDTEAVLAYHLTHHGMLKERSFFSGIAKLPAAHLMIVGRDRTIKRTWWQPARAAQIRLKSNDEYAEALREQMDRAIARSLRGNLEVGSHLSGGLDSSAVAVLASRQLRAAGRKLVRAYSWSPPPDVGDPASDERALIRMICDQEGLACEFSRLTPEDVCEYVSRDFSILPTESMQHELKVCESAASRCVRVMLSGWGGDEIVAFNGRGFFAEQFLRLRWRTLLREARRRAELHGEAVRQVLLSRVAAPLAPDWCHSLLGRNMNQHARSLLKGHPIEFDDFAPGAADILRDRWRTQRERPGVRAMQLRLLRNGHLTFRIEAWAHLGAQHGMIYRYPLLDRQLVEFCLRLPPRMYFQSGWKRFLFRYATGDLLPDALRWKKRKSDPAMLEQSRKVAQEGIRRFLDRWRQADEVPDILVYSIRRHELMAGLRQH
ncbi:MAG: asparagine synthase-related protein [Propylenella sp.]